MSFFSSTSFGFVPKLSIARNPFSKQLKSYPVNTAFKYLSTKQMEQNIPRGRVEQAIHNKLNERFRPVHLRVSNESYKHNVPKGSETHFQVVVVSEEFIGKRAIDCHRLVNSTLKDELATGVHALSIKTSVPADFDCNVAIEPTPNCLGGGKK